MYRAQEYPTFCADERSLGTARMRLVEPPRRAGGHGRSRSHTENSGNGGDSLGGDGWHGGAGRRGGAAIPAIANVAERLADEPVRSGTFPAPAPGGLTDQLFRHLTRHLGSISSAWSADQAGAPLGFQVVEFAPDRFEDAVVYSTLGLSDYILDSPTADGRFRLELIMVAPARLRGSALPFVVGDFGRMVLALRELPEIGTVVRNVPVLRDLSTMDALYLGRPPYFAPDFARFRHGDQAVNIDWLLPVSAPEATFVDAEGWAAFEKLIYGRDGIDPIDFGRASMPL